MKYFKVKAAVIKGTSYGEVLKKAKLYYELAKPKTKRKPYIRSAYFGGEKIFLDLFWTHLYEKKSRWDRIRRMKFVVCALELIQKSTFSPISKENPNNTAEILHRFGGKCNLNELFCVQIKEHKKSKKKWFMSVFPYEKKTFR